jgi:hypothetical protein
VQDSSFDDLLIFFCVYLNALRVADSLERMIDIVSSESPRGKTLLG